MGLYLLLWGKEGDKDVDLKTKQCNSSEDQQLEVYASK